MKFTVTYRGEDCKPQSEVFEAESRSDLFRILSDRKISAIRVLAGEVKEKKRSATQVSPKYIKTLVLILIASFVVGAIYLFWPESSNKATHPTSLPKKQKKTLQHRSNPSKIVLPPVPTETNKSDMIVLPNGIITNKPKTISEAIKMVRLKPGFHSYKNVDEVFSKTNLFQIGPYKTLNLKSSTESQLSLIATRSRTLTMPPMPPLPPHMEKDFEVAMNNYLTAVEGDSEADKETKKKIEMMKDMMHHYVEKEGMTPSQALREIEKEHNRAANMYQLYRGEYIKLARENSPDADAFYEAAVNKLKEKGAPLFDRNANYIDE